MQWNVNSSNESHLLVHVVQYFIYYSFQIKLKELGVQVRGDAQRHLFVRREAWVLPFQVGTIRLFYS